MFKCNLSQIQIQPYTPWRPQITQTTNCFIGCLENQMPSLDPYTAYIFYSMYNEITFSIVCVGFSKSYRRKLARLSKDLKKFLLIFHPFLTAISL